MLSGAEIADLLSRAVLAADQVQPNGVDLTVDGLWQPIEMGQLGRETADRHVPRREDMLPDVEGWWELPRGTYGLRFGTEVRLPDNCGGLAFPRSSLLRMGVDIPTAVWDAGYHGKGETLLQVLNPHGARIQRGARVAQLVLFRLTRPAASPYGGAYQGENLREVEQTGS